MAKSEYVLATGTLIKLELQPVDPRSLLQGDYVILGYTISELDLSSALKRGDKVQIILSPNPAGVYEYTGIYSYKGSYNKPYTPSTEDVAISAKVAGGGRLIYGIESFFVPEGTGLNVQATAKFAYVQVAANGDALLKDLSVD